MRLIGLTCGFILHQNVPTPGVIHNKNICHGFVGGRWWCEKLLIISAPRVALVNPLSRMLNYVGHLCKYMPLEFISYALEEESMCTITLDKLINVTFQRL